MSANAEYLSYALLGSSVDIVEVDTRSECSAHHLEVAYFTDVRLYGGLEHEQRERALAVGLHFIAFSVDRSRHIFYERNDIAKELHHAAYTHVFECADAEYGIYRAVNKTLANAFAHFIFGKMSLVKELFHQCFIVFGGSLNEFLVEFLSFFHLFGRNFLDCGYASIRPP